MSIRISQKDKKNYLVNNKPVWKQKGRWMFSMLITQEEIDAFMLHVNKVNQK